MQCFRAYPRVEHRLLIWSRKGGNVKSLITETIVGGADTPSGCGRRYELRIRAFGTLSEGFCTWAQTLVRGLGQSS